MFILYQAFCEETGSGSKKRTSKEKARTNKKRKVIEADLRDLSKDVVKKMKEDEMLNSLFKDYTTFAEKYGSTFGWFPVSSFEV